MAKITFTDELTRSDRDPYKYIIHAKLTGDNFAPSCTFGCNVGNWEMSSEGDFYSATFILTANHSLAHNEQITFPLLVEEVFDSGEIPSGVPAQFVFNSPPITVTQSIAGTVLKSSGESIFYTDVTLYNCSFYGDKTEDFPQGKLRIVAAPGGATARIWIKPKTALSSGGSITIPLKTYWFTDSIAPIGSLVVQYSGQLGDEASSLIVAELSKVSVNNQQLLEDLIENPNLFQSMEERHFGEPVELYVFSYGQKMWDFSSIDSPNIFRYTSGNEIIYKPELRDGEEVHIPFYPEPIHRDELQQTTDISKSTLNITVTKNNDIAKLFVPGTPVFPISVQIFKAFTDADTGVLDFRVMFMGRVSACTFYGFEAKIICDPIYSAIKRQGLRRKYEISCTHSLFSKGQCDLPKTAIPISGAYLNTSGSFINIPSSNTGFSDASVEVRTQSGMLVITNSAVADTDPTTNTNNLSGGFVSKAGHFTGGTVELKDGSVHLITRHEAGGVRLQRHLDPATDLIGMVIYHGCDHTFSRCKELGNARNFGGFPWFPDTNPFVGTHVPQGG